MYPFHKEVVMLFLIPVAVAALGVGKVVKDAVDNAQVAEAIKVQRDEFCENIRQSRITIEPKQK